MENGKNKDILIANLVRWEKNPRPQTTMQQNSDIEASIETKGVMLPLIVRACKSAKGMFEVIAGDRRRTTVQYLLEQGRWPADRSVSCIVRTDLDDDADAIDVAASENLHLPMNPMNQFMAFNEMVQGGKTVADIARSYGVTPRVVEQRLSYAKLDARARELVLQEVRDLTWASAMTVASPDEQDIILNEIESDPNRYRTALDIKRRLETELVPVSYALFDLADAGTDLVRKDLFDATEPSYLPTAEFIRLQDVALTKLVAERQADGWGRVSVVSDRDFDRWQYHDGIEDKARAEVIFVRHQSGQVVEYSGLALRAEVRINTADTIEDDAAGEALFGGDSEGTAPDSTETAATQFAEPTYSENKNTIAYLEKNRALVLQAMLMGSSPKLTTAVTVLGLLSESAPKPVEGRVFNDMKSIDAESHTRGVVDRYMEGMSRQLQAIGVTPDSSYEENLTALMKAEEGDLQMIQQVLIASRIGTNLIGIDRLFDAVSEYGDVVLSSVWRPDRALLETLSTEQIRGLAADILPSRLASKVKGKKTDMVETVFQNIDNAYGDGSRFDSVERNAILSWAPEILGGGRPGVIPDAFGDDEGSALFADSDIETAQAD